MVRLMLVLAPVMCILAGIGVSSMLTRYVKQIDDVKVDKKKNRFEGNYFMRSEVKCCMTLFLNSSQLILLRIRSPLPSFV